MIRQTLAVFLKDLFVELRAPARASGVFFFALVILVVVSFSVGVNTAILRQIAGATLWIGVLVASTRLLDQSFATELENNALEGMVLYPVSRFAIFYGKALANTAILLAVAVAMLPLTLALYDAPMRGSLLQLAGLFVLGAASIAAPGTFYAAITTRVRGAAVLLPVLLFPLVVPAMVAATRGTTVILDGDLMGEGPTWLSMLAVIDLWHWTVTGVLFALVVEETSP